MWYLEGFNPQTRRLAREHLLRNLDTPTIRRVLNVHDDWPIQPFDFEIPSYEALYELTKYGDELIDIEESLHYVFAFYADDGD